MNIYNHSEEDKDNFRFKEDTKLSKVDFLEWIVSECRRLSSIPKLNYESKLLEQYSERITITLMRAYESEVSNVEQLIRAGTNHLIASIDGQDRQQELQDICIISQFIKEFIMRIVKWKEKQELARQNFFINRALHKTYQPSPPVFVTSKLPTELLDDDEKPLVSFKRRRSSTELSSSFGAPSYSFGWPKVRIGDNLARSSEKLKREETVKKKQVEEENLVEVIEVEKPIKQEVVELDEGDEEEGIVQDPKPREEGSPITNEKGIAVNEKEKVGDEEEKEEEEDPYMRRSFKRRSSFALDDNEGKESTVEKRILANEEKEENEREMADQEVMMKEVKKEQEEEAEEVDHGEEEEHQQEEKEKEVEGSGDDGGNLEHEVQIDERINKAQMEDDYEEEDEDEEEEEDEEENEDGAQETQALPEDIDDDGHRLKRVLRPSKPLRPYSPQRPINPPPSRNTSEDEEPMNSKGIWTGARKRKLAPIAEGEAECSSATSTEKILKASPKEPLSEFDLYDQQPSSSKINDVGHHKYSSKVKIRKRKDYEAEQKLKRRLAHCGKVVRFLDRKEERVFTIAPGNSMHVSTAIYNTENSPYFFPTMTTRFLKTIAKPKKDMPSKISQRAIAAQANKEVRTVVSVVGERLKQLQQQLQQAEDNKVKIPHKERLVRLNRLLVTDALLERLDEKVLCNTYVLRTLEYPKDMGTFVTHGLDTNAVFLANPGNAIHFEFSYIFIVYGHDQIVHERAIPVPSDFLTKVRDWFHKNLPFCENNKLMKSYETETDYSYFYSPPQIVAVTLPEIGEKFADIRQFNSELRDFVNHDSEENIVDSFLLLDWAKLVEQSPDSGGSEEQRVKLLVKEMCDEFGVLIK